MGAFAVSGSRQSDPEQQQLGEGGIDRIISGGRNDEKEWNEMYDRRNDQNDRSKLNRRQPNRGGDGDARSVSYVKAPLTFTFHWDHTDLASFFKETKERKKKEEEEVEGAEDKQTDLSRLFVEMDLRAF